jgi:hypothetical protein
MAREIPEAVRAAAGLAATVLDEARRLPETLPGLPVRVLGLAMQLSMKLQQHYAGLVARGDELLTGIRGEDEPGLATFDDDDHEAAPAAVGGFGTSSFDRVAETVIEVTEDDEADAVVDEALDELAIEELAEQAGGEDGAAALADAVLGGDNGSDADGLPESAVLETSPAPGADAPSADQPAPSDPGGSPVGEAAGGPDVATTVDVVAPDGGVETVEAAVTDEGVAAVEGSAVGGSAVEGSGESAQPDGATATDEGGTPVAAATGAGTPAADSQAGRAPVEGYDDWSIAQLRGRLRGYQVSTVTDLIAYEEATRAREPYLRMLRNRLEKLDEQAIEASPLQPRG